MYEGSVVEVGPSPSELGKEVRLRLGRGLTLRVKDTSEAASDETESTDIVAVATGLVRLIT